MFTQEHMNAIRSESARCALDAYIKHTQSNEDLATNVTDLLTDLRHLCDEEGVDFDHALERSWTHYQAEIVPDDIEQTFLEAKNRDA